MHIVTTSTAMDGATKLLSDSENKPPFYEIVNVFIEDGIANPRIDQNVIDRAMRVSRES